MNKHTSHVLTAAIISISMMTTIITVAELSYHDGLNQTSSLSQVENNSQPLQMYDGYHSGWDNLPKPVTADIYAGTKQIGTVPNAVSYEVSNDPVTGDWLMNVMQSDNNVESFSSTDALPLSLLATGLR